MNNMNEKDFLENFIGLGKKNIVNWAKGLRKTRKRRKRLSPFKKKKRSAGKGGLREEGTRKKGEDCI